MDLRAVNDMVIVKRDDAPKATSSGIILTDLSSEKLNTGTVLAVGPGVKSSAGVLIALDVQVNDRVMFADDAGKEIKSNNEEYLVLKESDIFGVLEV